MLSALLISAAAPDEPAFLRSPDVHGDKVVFTCEGDLWLGTISTGLAVRITRHSGTEVNAKFSPDGKQIAFSAEYDGIQEAYVMPTEGGTPKRVSYTADYARVQDWTPDGKSILVRGRSLPRSFGLYLLPIEGGPGSKLPIEFSAWAGYGETEAQFVFTRFFRDSDAWFHYKGGMQNQIWSANLAGKSFKQITDVKGTNEFPVVAKGQAVFVNENDAKFQVMSVPLAGGRAKALGSASNVEIRELASGTGMVVYEKGREIELLNPETGKTTELKFALHSEKQHTLPYRVEPAKHIDSLSLSPSGKRVLAGARGQILDMPAGEGEARLWKSEPGARLRHPRMSPDGKLVAFISDKTGEQQLYVSSPAGESPKAITKDLKRQLVAYYWSPDSKWILLYDSEMRLRLINVESGEDRLVKKEIQSWGPPAVSFSPDSQWIVTTQTDGISGQSSLAFYNIPSKEMKVVAHPLAFDSSPAFSSDGKHLVFISRRTFNVSWDSMLNQMNTGPGSNVCLMLLTKDGVNPLALSDVVETIGQEAKPAADAAKPAEAKPEDKATKIDFEGLYDRVLTVPLPAGSYSQAELVGTRLIFTNSGMIGAYDLKAKSTVPITTGGGFELSADKSKMLVGNRVVDVNGVNVPGSAGAVNAGGLRLQINPTAEWKQMYWDAWRLLRDYFYVANMHGVDWKAIGDKYAVYLDSIRSRDELDILIRWMQAELGTSHQYLSPGDERTLGAPSAGAFLGIDVEPAGTKLRVKKIYRGDGLRDDEMSPLAAPGIGMKDGDYLLAVAGTALTNKSNYLEHLADRAGQIVSVTFSSSIDGSNPKTVYVKPIGNETRIRRLEWVEQNRRYVEKASGGKVGYLYLGAMVGQDVSDFIKQFYPQRNKEALLIDTRFNNGGNVQSILNRILAEPLTGFFNMRASDASWTRQGDYFLGPMAVVQNEFNVSCGEEFPHRFRDLKLGAVIGRRTYGGEVGSAPGWPLADGGVVSVPNYGMWTPDGKWVIEGPGVEPDIDVQSDPNAFAQGKDPQLDKSVEWLLDQLKKNPIKRPVQPADPVRIKKP